MKAIIDIETGGFDLKKDAVVEIALIVVNENNEVVEEYSSLVMPYFIPGTDVLTNHGEDAQKVHGISIEERLAFGKLPIVVCAEINEILMKHVVKEFIGHNIERFDMPRIENFFNHYSLEQSKRGIKGVKLIDTLFKTRAKFNLESYSLGNLCKYFGIKVENQHRALGDCVATLELYKTLVHYENN